MHAIKIRLLLTYYLNTSVQAANLSDCRIESKKNPFGSENRIETFLPELECSSNHSVTCKVHRFWAIGWIYGRGIISWLPLKGITALQASFHHFISFQFVT